MAASELGHIVCPMCAFSDEEYFVTLHLEQVHFADESPFVVRDGSSAPTILKDDHHVGSYVATASQGSLQMEYIACPEEGCGEEVLWGELQEHIDLHLAEKLTLDEALNMHSFPEHHPLLSENIRLGESESLSLSALQGRREPQESVKVGIHRGALTPGSALQAGSSKLQQSKAKVVGRLGSKELGPHAHEDRMPDSVLKILERDAKVKVTTTIGTNGTLLRQEIVNNQTPGILPVLAQLFEQDHMVGRVYLCHPSVRHVAKAPGAAGFCGYQTTQMLMSYIRGAKAQGYERFPQAIPGVLQMQDWIEDAWDMGINVSGRIETGGVKGTRKWIGTPEAQALFARLGIDCHASSHADSTGLTAHEQLLRFVEKYFARADNGHKVCKTLLPPIYLQRQGHSVAIVGYETRSNGTSNLLIFDSLHKPSPAIMSCLGKLRPKCPSLVLNTYRWGQDKMRKYSAFETLALTIPPPDIPAWDVSDPPYMGCSLSFTDHGQDFGFSCCESFESVNRSTMLQFETLQALVGVFNGGFSSASTSRESSPTSGQLDRSDFAEVLCSGDLVLALFEGFETGKRANSPSLAARGRIQQAAMESSIGEASTNLPPSPHPYTLLASRDDWRPSDGDLTSLGPCDASVGTQRFFVHGFSQGGTCPKNGAVPMPTLEAKALTPDVGRSLNEDDLFTQLRSNGKVYSTPNHQRFPMCSPSSKVLWREPESRNADCVDPQLLCILPGTGKYQCSLNISSRRKLSENVKISPPTKALFRLPRDHGVDLSMYDA